MTTAPWFDSAEHRAQDVPAPLPGWRDVLMEHVRTMGAALRVPILIALALAVVGTIALAVQVRMGNIDKHFLAEPSSLPGIIGALLPVALWAREERFGPGFLWTLPVDRSRHALLRVLAGWLWLMAGVALYLVCQLVLALVHDGTVLPVVTLQILTAPLATSGPLDPAALRAVQWAPGPIVWIIPIAAATATYLVASAIMLGIRHHLRWFAGALVAAFVANVIAEILSRLLGAPWLSGAPARALTRLIDGRFGLEMLLTLRTWSLDTRVTMTTGERLHAWAAVPSLADWRIAALLWTAAGLVALWAAAARHREQR